MADRDRNKKVLLELLKMPGNGRCADCQTADPDWASYRLGIFICLNCSGTHRNLPEVSRVKSIRLDFWDDDLVEYMKCIGNNAAKAIYEKDVPIFYYRPKSSDCVVLKEQWIRAKYERREFTGDKSQPQSISNYGSHQGFLWKRGKENSQFLRRKFILSMDDYTLKYYNKEESKGPKAVIFVKDLNALFQPEKIGHNHGLQLTFLKDEHTRNIFVYHEEAKEIVHWYNAIRAVRFSYLKTAFPTATDLELLPWITRNYLKQGYMEKTGPMHREPFKKRWFILDSQERRLLYFKCPLDATEKGSVFIGSKEHGYDVTNSLPKGARGNKWKCGITVVTPDRKFVFTCENERELREWIEVLNAVITRPMSPQDYTTEANVRRRR
ncbi:arf-GAP with dual PH domain-containing protein 2 [Polypterus senegalus]|uniref:arf-GAP with dual PH domain-containing protein 2 n=1 Tax=Polypterus senegalus TaxID=55291 RepID=UPI0019625198|nr:arf-GAP with dual PH domain-containing protein 2 [Polypterus senegalus]